MEGEKGMTTELRLSCTDHLAMLVYAMYQRGGVVTLRIEYGWECEVCKENAIFRLEREYE